MKHKSLILKIKLHIVFLFVSLWLIPEINAQRKVIGEGLLNQLAHSKGEERIPILLDLAKFYQNNDQEKTIQYAEESLLLSKQINDQLNIGRAYIMLGDAHMISGKFDESIRYFEKAIPVFTNVKSEKDEIRLYIYMGETYIRMDEYGKAEEYYQKSLNISRKTGNKKYIAWGINNLVGIYIEKGEIKKAKTAAFEALTLAEELKDKNLQINLHVKIASALEYKNESLEQITKHYEKALQLAIEKENPRAMSGININWGSTFMKYEKYKQAEQYYFNALEVSKKYNQSNRMILAYYGLGQSSYYRGNYKLSMSYFEEALEVVRKTNNKGGEASIYAEIGDIYAELGNYKKSIEFLYKSLKYYEELEDQQELSVLYNKIGEAFDELNNFIMAEENYNKSLLLFEKLDNQNGVVTSYLNLGNLKIKQKKFNEAILFLNKARDRINEIGFTKDLILYYNAMAECKYKEGHASQALDLMQKVMMMKDRLKKFKKLEIESYTRLGTIYYELKKYDEAKEFFDKSLTSALEIQSKKELQANYFWLSKCYEKLNQYEKGLRYFKLYTNVKDSVFSIEKIKQISDIQIKYDTDKKEKEILLLQREKEYQRVLFNSQKNELYRVKLEKDLAEERKNKDIIRLKVAQRQNDIERLSIENDLQIAENEIKNNQLSIQKSQIAHEVLIRNVVIAGAGVVLIILFLGLIYYRQRLNTQKIINKKEIETINANIEGQEKERERIAKELHDGIAGNLAAIKLELSQLSTHPREGLKKVIKNVDNTYSEIRTLSHDLIPSKILKSPFEKIVKDYLNDLSKNFSFTIVNDFYPTEGFNQLTDKIKIELYRITQELMNNIIKHSHADQVHLQYTIIEKEVKLIVEDNGIGFDLQIISKGIGLENILSRTKSLKGDMHIDSKVNRGTIVEIIIPIEDKEKRHNSRIPIFNKSRII